jgi:ferritin-like metal-binding protein YciE
MPQAVSIIPHEVHIGEAHKHISSLQQIFKRKERQIENADS